jgi:toxin ParE1/3/4
MRLELHAEVLAEIQGAAEYYESRKVGLGIQFLHVLGETFDRITRNPLAWFPVDEDIRRCLTRVFPYGVYYSVESEYVLVLAVAHVAREPGYWSLRR